MTTRVPGSLETERAPRPPKWLVWLGTPALWVANATIGPRGLIALVLIRPGAAIVRAGCRVAERVAWADNLWITAILDSASFNGRTADFGPADRGSIPRAEAKQSAGDLYLSAVEEWLSHMEEAHGDDACDHCVLSVNRVRLARKVWQSSTHKAVSVASSD